MFSIYFSFLPQFVLSTGKSELFLLVGKPFFGKLCLSDLDPHVSSLFQFYLPHSSASTSCPPPHSPPLWSSSLPRPHWMLPELQLWISGGDIVLGLPSLSLVYIIFTKPLTYPRPPGFLSTLARLDPKCSWLNLLRPVGLKI